MSTEKIIQQLQYCLDNDVKPEWYIIKKTIERLTEYKELLEGDENSD